METWWTDPDARLNTSSGSLNMGSGTSSIPSTSPGPNPQVVYHNDALLRQLQQSSASPSSASVISSSQPGSKASSGRELKSLTQQVQKTASPSTQSGSRKSGGNANFAAAFQQQMMQQSPPQQPPPHQQNQANFQDAFMMQFQKAGQQQQNSQPRNKVSDRVLPYPTEEISLRYDFGKKLGEGAFGTVYEVRSKKTNKVYACKCISKTKLVRSQDRQDVVREIDIMDHAKGHPNIISFRNVFENNEAIQIVMEVCEGGELFDLIVKRGYFREAEAAKTMKVMLRLTAYLHSKCIVHRDIKPENFLLVSKLREDQKFGRGSSKKKGSSSSSEDSSEPIAESIFEKLDEELRITDFGLSARISRPDDTSLRQVVGTPFYVAPEVLRGDNYGSAVDVWSLGCIAYILLSGRPPFAGASTDEILAAVRKGTYDLKSKPWNGKLSESARDFVSRMLAFDPNHRPSCEEMLKHPWLTSKDSLRSSYSLKGTNMTDLKAFCQTNNFKKAALLACAHTLDTQQVKALEKVFRQIDSDNSGKVSVSELCDYLRRKNKSIDNKELMQLVEAFDCDQSGDLDYDEFLVAASKFHTLNKPENLIRVFKEFDMNHDGVLSLEEIQLALKRSGMDPSEAKKWMQEYDTDGSGSIDYYEFLAMMQKGNQQLEDACSHFKALTIF